MIAATVVEGAAVARASLYARSIDAAADLRILRVTGERIETLLRLAQSTPLIGAMAVELRLRMVSFDSFLFAHGGLRCKARSGTPLALMG